jgi:Immunity protein 63
MTKPLGHELLSISNLRDCVRTVSDKLGLSEAGPDIGFGVSSQDGTPHIEVDTAYHYVICERGEEFGRRTTHDIDELLYWIASDLTFVRAVDHELRNRVEGQDFRRILFQYQRELMAQLSLEWSRRLDIKIEETLAAYPFVDGLDY